MLALSLMLSMALPSVQAETGDGTTSAPLLTCLPFTQWQEGQSLTSPLTYGDVQFYADNLRVGNLDGSGLPELTWTGQLKIFVPGATAVKLSIVQYGEPATIVT